MLNCDISPYKYDLFVLFVIMIMIKFLTNVFRLGYRKIKRRHCRNIKISNEICNNVLNYNREGNFY